MGLVSISLNQDLDPVISMTKAEELSFKVEIVDLRNDVIIKTINDHRELVSNPISLKAGNYKVIASNGENLDAAFDAPYYKGETEIAVVVGETTVANISCTLANVKASVSFSEAVTSNFTTYDVTISNGVGSLLFDKTNNSRSGYFKATTTLSWSIRLVNTDGVEHTISNTISDVKPREHYKFNFDVDGNSDATQGGTSLSIRYDTELNNKDHNININLNKRGIPVISEASGASLDGVLRAPQGAGVLGMVNITAMAGITEVRFRHTSEQMSGWGIPSEIVIPGEDQQLVNSYGISWGAVTKGVTTSTTIDFRSLLSSHLSLGNYTFIISVLDEDQQYVEKTIEVKVVPDIEVSIISLDPWGRFVNVYGQYNTETTPKGLALLYKKSSDSDWKTFSGELVMDGGVGPRFGAKVGGLDPKTEYQFKLVTTKDDIDDNILTTTTQGADLLPNMGFDNWSANGAVWYPNTTTDPSSSDFFWDTANGGTKAISIYPTNPESEHVIKGKAARLETCYKMKLAAGNIYTGSFGKLNLGTMSASVNFGRPYTCRPLRMKGYVDYQPKPIDKYDNAHNHLAGNLDYGQIYVVLTDWAAPYTVDSAQGNFIDKDAPYVIGYGEVTYNANTNGYIEFSIDIEYKNGKTPSYIAVVCAASKYGDYFTGGVGTLMYLDEFTFEFE